MVAAHVHTIVHHWVNNIPVMVADSYAKNLNAMYLTYDKTSGKVIREQTQIEVIVNIFLQSKHNFIIYKIIKKNYLWSYIITIIMDRHNL